MAKVRARETCAEAIRSFIKPGETVSFSEFVVHLRRKGIWKEDTICQHLMSLVTNLPPARLHWKSAKPFLFLRGDGRYELYDLKIHPQIIE